MPQKNNLPIIQGSATGLKDRSGAAKDQISLQVGSKMDSDACEGET